MCCLYCSLSCSGRVLRTQRGGSEEPSACLSRGLRSPVSAEGVQLYLPFLNAARCGQRAPSPRLHHPSQGPPFRSWMRIVGSWPLCTNLWPSSEATHPWNHPCPLRRPLALPPHREVLRPQPRWTLSPWAGMGSVSNVVNTVSCFVEIASPR